MIAFLDSSALLKLYLMDEPGSEAVREAMSGEVRNAMSRLTYVEVRSGLAAARRAGRLAPTAHDVTVIAFERASAEFDQVEFDEVVGLRAGDLAEAYGLRTGDAIQLASAQELSGDGVVLVAWDLRLRAAATAAGLPIFPQTI